jgi:hypothetical protein
LRERQRQATGVFFEIHPANRAKGLRPIEAFLHGKYDQAGQVSAYLLMVESPVRLQLVDEFRYRDQNVSAVINAALTFKVVATRFELVTKGL